MLQTLGAVALVGYLSYRSGQQSVEDLSHQLMDEVGDRATLYLEKTLAIPHLVNQLNADAIQLGVIPGFESEDTATLERYFLRQIVQFPSVSTIAIANERGGIVGAGQQNPLPSAYRTPQFAAGVFSSSDVDPQGTLLNTETLSPNYDARPRPWYQTPKQAGKATWSSIYEFIASQPMLGISAGLPMYDSSGKLRGVLSTDIVLHHLNQFLQELTISSSGVIFIIERSGLLVASSTEQPLFTSANNTLKRINATESDHSIIRATTTELIQEIGPLTQIHTSQHLHFHQHNARQMVQVIPFRDRIGLDWLVVIVVPEADFMAKIWANSQRTAVLSGLALLGTIALGLWTARYITRPIARLNRATRAFSRGEVLPPLPPTSIAEINALRVALNQMMDQLDISFRSLQDNQQTLKTFLDSVPVGISIHVPPGQVLFINAKGQDILKHGVTTTPVEQMAEVYQLYQANTNKLYPTDQLPALRGLQGESAYANDIEIQVNGRRIPVEIYTTPVFDQSGTVLYSINAFQDITERRQAEHLRLRYEQDLERQVAEQTQALRESEAHLQQSEIRFQQLAANIPGIIYTTVHLPEGSTQIEYISAAVKDLLEVTPEQVLADPSLIFNQWHPDDRDSYYQAERQSLATLTPFVYEWRVITPSGRLKWLLERRSRLERRSNGDIVGYGIIQETTDRRQAEEHLRAESDFRRTIESAIVEGIAIVDLEGRQSYVNPAFCRMVGWSEAELLGATPPFVYWPPEDIGTITQAFQSCLEAGRPPQGLELRFMRRNGERFDVLLLDAPLRNAQGEATAWLASVYDITERKQAQLALQQAHLELNYHIDHSPLATIRWDRDFRVERWSKRAEEMFGWAAAEVLGKAVHEWQFVVEEDIEKVNQFIARLRTGEAVLGQNRNYRRDGSIAYSEWYNSVLVDDEGNLVSILSLVQDVTDRTLTEFSLQRYERIVSATTDAMSLVDRHYRYQIVNQAYLDWHGKPLDDIVGHTISELMGEEVFQTIIRPRFDRCLAGETVQYHEWFDFPSGGRQFLSVTYSPFFEGDHSISGIVVSLRNITPLKQVEEALRQSEQRFREIAQTISQVFFVRSAVTGQFIYITPSYEQVWGYSCESLYQNPHSWIQAIHPDDRPVVTQSLAHQFAGNSVQREYRIIRSDGAIRWIFAQINLVRDELDNPVRFIGVAVDITDRKHTEEALRLSQTRFQELATASPVVIYTVVEYPDGPVRYEFLSPAFEEIHELPVEKAVENPLLVIDQVHPEDRAGYQRAIAQSLEGMQTFRHQWRIITPSGRIKWIQASSRPERRSNGEIAWHGVVQDVTEQKQIEQALQAALHEINVHFDNSPLAIVQWSQNFEVLRWSTHAERMFGWSAGEVKSLSWQEWDFVYVEDRDRVNQTLAPLLNGVVPNCDIQNRNYTKDGRVILCQWYSSAVFDETGQLLSILSFAQDITDRKQAELELIQAKDLLEAIFNESTDAIFLVNLPPVSSIIDCNQRAVELFEMDSKEELIETRGNLLQRHQLTQDELTQIELELQHRGYWSREIEYSTKYGKSFWGSLAVKPIQIADQTWQLVRLTDISERKHAEQALRQSESTNRALVQAIPDLLIRMRRDGTYLDIHSSTNVSLYNPTSLRVGASIFDVLPHAVAKERLQYVQQVLETGRVHTYEYQLINEYEVLYEEARIVPCGEDEVLVIIRDISHRYKIDRMKDEFISVVSHELRTPLAAIRGSLGLLHTGKFNDRPERVHELLQLALNNSDRLVRLVNDILTLERLESGKVQLTLDFCNVADLMQDAADSVKAIAEEVQIILDVVPLEAYIQADPDSIVQTLTNLLSNAIKFSPAHSTISLTAEWIEQEEHALPDEGPWVRLAVRDRGRGIPADKLDAIFGRFQQVDVSDSRQKGGTGLGLAICKSIVQQHGGYIWVESVLGQGSVFYVLLAGLK